MTGFQTDKVQNGYLPTYLRIAAQIGIGGWVLELGVDDGHSLRMWEALFPKGRVVGVDIRPECLGYAGASTVIILEQDSLALTTELAMRDLRLFDLIVDDASHLGKQTRRSLFNLWPFLDAGGHYVIEDWGVGFPAGAPMYDPAMMTLAQDLPLQFDPKGDLTEHRGLQGLARIIYEPGLIILERE